MPMRFKDSPKVREQLLHGQEKDVFANVGYQGARRQRAGVRAVVGAPSCI